MTVQLNPYLIFRDNAREAMEFYQSVFGGRLEQHEFKEFQVSGDPGEDSKIMHASLDVGNGIVFMGADTPKDMPYHPGSSISMSLSGDDEEELTSYFQKLSEGGTVTLPLEDAPWGDKFGMLTDRFGIEWMVNISGRS